MTNRTVGATETDVSGLHLKEPYFVKVVNVVVVVLAITVSVALFSRSPTIPLYWA
jgi:hypothetical protein